MKAVGMQDVDDLPDRKIVKRRGLTQELPGKFLEAGMIDLD